jgi:hypothetical protein
MPMAHATQDAAQAQHAYEYTIQEDTSGGQ